MIPRGRCFLLDWSVRLQHKNCEQCPHGHQEEGHGKGEEKDPAALAMILDGQWAVLLWVEIILPLVWPKEAFPILFIALRLVLCYTKAV